MSLKADVEMKNGDIKNAVTTLEALVDKYPNDASSLLRLSELKSRLGNKQAAGTLLDRAAQAGQNEPVVRDRIISIAMRTGDNARVKQLAEQAMMAMPQDPQSHLVKAAALGFQNDVAGARRATLDALDLNPAFDAALTALSKMATEEPQQRQELLSRYEKAVESRKASAQAYLGYAALLKADEKTKAKVIPLLEKGVVALPTSSGVREALVEEHMLAGNADAALTVAQTGAAVNNAPAADTALLARTYERTGKTDLATETYRKLVAGYPQRTDWRLKLAELEAGAGRAPQASTLLRGLITDRPFDSTAYIALAKLMVRDNPKEALSVAAELGEREPHKLTAMLLEGDILAQSGKLDDALKQFAKAAKAGSMPAASLRVVGVLDKAGRGNAADEELNITLRRYLEDPTVLGYAAQRALAQGKPEKAVEWLQKIATRDPRNPVLLNDLAWAQVQAKQPQAIDNALAAVRLMPGNAIVLDTLGMAQALAGRRAEAIASLRTAVNLMPTAAGPRMHLAELLIATQDRAAAGVVLAQVTERQLTKSDQEKLASLKKSTQN
jgi:putative PEP-CTERM system TPR-repeat lipoprotein